MFQLAKNGTLFGLVRFSLYFLFACAAINQANLAFKTTIIEDTHLTLAVIPFKIEANNLYFFTNIREKPVNLFYCSTQASTLVSAVSLLTQVPLQKFLFLLIIISPWTDQGIINC